MGTGGRQLGEHAPLIVCHERERPDAVRHASLGEPAGQLPGPGQGEPGHWREPIPGFPVPWRAPLELRDAGQGGLEGSGLGAAQVQEIIEPSQVPPGEHGLDLGHPVVMAQLRHRGRSGGGRLPVRAERAAAIGQFLAAGQDEAAFPGPQNLAVLETEAPGVPERAEGLAADARAVRLAGILDHVQAVARRETQEAAGVGGPAPHVDGHDGAGPRCQLRPEVVIVEIGSCFVAVDEHRPGSGVKDWGGRHHDRHGGHQNLITRADPESRQRAVQRCGSAGHGDRVRGAEGAGELGFELIDVRRGRRRGHRVQEPAKLVHRPPGGWPGPGHGASRSGRKSSKPVSGHMFTQSLENSAQSAGQSR